MNRARNRRFRRLVVCLVGLVPLLLLAVWLNGNRPAAATAMPPSPPVGAPMSEPITATEAYTSYLPIALNSPNVVCRADDFSDPASGWPNGRMTFGRAYYDSGVYRMVDVPLGAMLFIGASPDWVVPNDAAIQVRGRIDVGEDTSIGFSPYIGLVFGMQTLDIGGGQIVWLEWYSFNIVPHSQTYSVRKWWHAGQDYADLTTGTSAAILTDPQAWQLIEVRRDDAAMTLIVNNSVIETITDATDPLAGRRSVGIGAGEVFTVTFDDFRVCGFGEITPPAGIAGSDY